MPACYQYRTILQFCFWVPGSVTVAVLIPFVHTTVLRFNLRFWCTQFSRLVAPSQPPSHHTYGLTSPRAFYLRQLFAHTTHAAHTISHTLVVLTYMFTIHVILPITGRVYGRTLLRIPSTTCMRALFWFMQHLFDPSSSIILPLLLTTGSDICHPTTRDTTPTHPPPHISRAPAPSRHCRAPTPYLAPYTRSSLTAPRTATTPACFPYLPLPDRLGFTARLCVVGAFTAYNT